MEKCNNCNRDIGKLEQVFVFKDNIVCGECDSRLRKQVEASVSITPSVLPAPTAPKSPDTTLVIISFLIPLVGFIIGAIFISKPSKADKKTGESCLIWATISIIVGIILWGMLLA
jgi:hypothetical protein